MLAFLMVIEDQQTRHKLETIYLTYHREMYAIAYGILNHVQDAQDVVQSSIIKMAKYIDAFSDPHCNKTRALFVTIIRNTAINIYRHKKNHPATPIDHLAEDFEDEHDSVEQYVIRIGDVAWLKEKMAALKVEYAEILALKYSYDFTDSEIAELLSIEPGNMRIRLHRAKAALRKLVGEGRDV